MDLHLTDDSPSRQERTAIDLTLGPPDSGWEGGERDPVRDGHVAVLGREARSRRRMLLPALHAVQDAVGWISPGAVNHIARRLTVPPADIYGVATFYALLATRPRPPVVVHVCDDIVCTATGSAESSAAAVQLIGIEGEAEGGAMWLRSPCLGRCDQGSAAFVQKAGSEPFVVAPADRTSLEAALGDAPDAGAMARETAISIVPQGRLAVRAAGGTVASLDHYLAEGGYGSLRKALAIGAPAVLDELTESALVGRGGAAFPTAAKWRAVATAPAQPHYVVANADESEPGTFKDRILLENDPFAVVEAMTIAGFATGSSSGYIYVRGEYPLAISRLRDAIDQAVTSGMLGGSIMESDFCFTIEIRRGAGAYICGEETALFNSIEGYRGEPRAKPPYPTDRGLFGKPTAVNNVETLVAVLDVIERGGASYRRLGTAGTTGTKLFSVSGHVATPGVYEVEPGITLRELLDLAGGMRAGSELRAVLLGGAAGTFVVPEALDLPLSIEGTRKAGTGLGSGAVIVFDTTTDMNAVVRRIAAFFRHESCGQCVPCRVGTVRQEETVARFTAAGSSSDRELLGEIGRAMRDASICGLGQLAASAVRSAIDHGLIGARP